MSKIDKNIGTIIVNFITVCLLLLLHQNTSNLRIHIAVFVLVLKRLDNSNVVFNTLC